MIELDHCLDARSFRALWALEEMGLPYRLHRLGDREWLCAGRFTMADLCVAYALLLAGTLNLEHRFSPEIAAFWDRVSTRPGFLAAKAAQL